MPFQYCLILLVVAGIAIGADARKKLVCQQADNTLDAPRGYCTLLGKKCKCTTDCISTLSKQDCVCKTNDLLYAEQTSLMNCSVWTEMNWRKYLVSSRSSSDFMPVTPGNDDGGKTLKFSTTEKDIGWPITRALGSESLFIHGPHCLHMVEKFNGIIKSGKMLDNSFDRSHADHCRRLIRRVLAYYTTSKKEYTVQPESLCQDLRTEYLGHSILSLPGAKDDIRGFSFGYGTRFGYGKRSVDLNDPKSAPQRVYEMLYAVAQKAENTTKPSQQTVLELVSGHNLGNLLVKEWLQKPLNPTETRYIQEWESDYVVRMAAFGIYCVTGNGKSAPIETIRNVLLMK